MLTRMFLFQTLNSHFQKRRVNSAKDRLHQLQELRRDDGTWVECCKPECKKWRYLEHTKDPSQVPKYWSVILLVFYLSLKLLNAY